MHKTTQQTRSIEKHEAADTLACVRTAPAAAAIGSIEIEGPDALPIVQRIFRPAGEHVSFEEGQILYGRFLDADRIIDDGLVGVEGPDRLALHCHGNPLILQQILTLLQKHGAAIITPEQTLARRFFADCNNTIEAEAQLESIKAVSLLGVKIIRNQTTTGLLNTVRQWLDSTDSQTLRQEAEEILLRSQIAQRIIRGVRIVIAGPPNSGKSTLLNRLAGRRQALVSETPGTTRDWVTCEGRIEPLQIEWIDTAGLDERLAGGDDLEQTAQRTTRELLDRCDLILYVMDGTRAAAHPLSPSAAAPVLRILNKSDLPGFQSGPNAIPISAKDGTGLETLARAILQTLQADSFDPAQPVAFTDRQKDLLRQIAAAGDPAVLKSRIGRLFQEPKPV